MWVKATLSKIPGQTRSSARSCSKERSIRCSQLELQPCLHEQSPWHSGCVRRPFCLRFHPNEASNLQAKFQRTSRVPANMSEPPPSSRCPCPPRRCVLSVRQPRKRPRPISLCCPGLSSLLLDSSLAARNRSLHRRSENRYWRLPKRTKRERSSGR